MVLEQALSIFLIVSDDEAADLYLGSTDWLPPHQVT